MIYFFGTPSHIKIGYSTNPVQRFLKMQTDCPDKLEPLGVMEGDAGREKEIHRLFVDFRDRGEWFLRCDYTEKWVLDNVEPFPITRPRFGVVPNHIVTKEVELRGGYVTLNEWLVISGRSAKWLAKRLEVSPAIVSRYRGGHVVPSRDVLVKIIKETNGAVTPNSFFLDELNKVTPNDFLSPEASA